jgi:hypothetical protein
MLLICEGILLALWMISGERWYGCYKLSRWFHRVRWNNLVEFAECVNFDEVYEGPEEDYWKACIWYRRKNYFLLILVFILLIIGSSVAGPEFPLD